MKDTLTSAQILLIEAVKASLLNSKIDSLNNDVLDEAENQAVLPLVSNDMQAKAIMIQNVLILSLQYQLNDILKGIPFIVIKGAAAAIYYPEPLRRVLGDIDIVVAPSFFNDAYLAMKNSGFSTEDPMNRNDRHVHFKKNGILVELHRRYAILQSREQERNLDSWIYSEKPVIATVADFDFPMPKDQLNGLVILSHINQHLESGLGLRHIIDWAMYVDKCLPDTAWPAFRDKAELIGMTSIAKAFARLGQLYFGLYQEYTWCKDISTQTVEELMLYILECGNLGNKAPKTIPMTRTMSFTLNPITNFMNLQQRGVANWKAARKYKCLKPFAWIYQGCRYLIFGIKGDSFFKLWHNLTVSRRRNKLFMKLGIVRDSNRGEKQNG